MERIDIEKEFMKISSDEVESGNILFDEAIRNIEASLPQNNVHSKYQPQILRNSAGEKFGFASEHFLKSNIIFDDFSRSSLFTQPTGSKIIHRDREIVCPGIGTPEWRLAIAGEGEEKKLQILSDPKLILSDIIKVNNPNDPRNIITNDDRFNADFLTLKLSGSAPKGHSLYAYYQLQHPVVKSLINSEFFTYVEDEFNYTIYALLTDDILKKDSGTILMPRNLMEKLDSVKAASVNLRYASISGKNINDDELRFLKEFTSSLLHVSEYRFPLQKKYNEFGFDKYNFDNFSEKNNADFLRLDQMQKYYLQSNFSNKELISLKEYIFLLRKNGVLQTDIDIFVAISIYFKNYVNNILKIKLNFENEQFSRIFNFCNVVKAYQPFDAENKRLCDNPAFDTLEKRKSYTTEIKVRQRQTQQSEKKEQNPFNMPQEQIIKDITKLDAVEIQKILQQINVSDWLSLGYTYTQFVNMIRRHPALLSYDINVIKEKLTNMQVIGYSKERVLKVTARYPKLLDYELEHFTDTINNLVSLGYTNGAARKIVQTFPALFLFRKDFIEQKIIDISSLGYTYEEVIQITEKNPNIFAVRAEVIDEKKKYYEHLGIGELLIKNPQLFNFSIEKMNNEIADIKKLGYSNDEAIKLITNNPHIIIPLSLSFSKKFNEIIRIGYTKEDVLKMTNAFPGLFKLRTENIKKKKEFYDFIGIGQTLIDNPSQFKQPLNVSYARYMFFITQGILINTDNFKQLFLSSTEFNKKYGVDDWELIEKFKMLNNKDDEDNMGNNPPKR